MIKKFDTIDAKQFLLTFYQKKQERNFDLDDDVDIMLLHVMFLFVVQNDVKDLPMLIDLASNAPTVDALNYVCENLQNDPTFAPTKKHTSYKMEKGLSKSVKILQNVIDNAITYCSAKRFFLMQQLNAPLKKHQLDEIAVLYAETDDEIIAIKAALEASRKQVMIEKPSLLSKYKNKTQNANLEQNMLDGANAPTNKNTQEREL